MIMGIDGYESLISLLISKPNVFSFGKTDKLFTFQRNIEEMIDGFQGRIKLINGDKLLNFGLEVEMISDLMSMSLNNRKTLTHLHKMVVTEVGKSDQILEFENIKEQICQFMTTIKGEFFLNVDFDKDIKLDKMFKLLDIKYNDDYNQLSVLLYKYIQLLIETRKIKVLFIVSLLYYLESEEVECIAKLCFDNDVYLVLLEKSFLQGSNSLSLYDIIDMELLL